ncbi:Synaptic vesicular amine transporter [Folsomia candida]|uniref:Synaptic vesicular amine transporter n=1 Tax=Folsomia candida TaxID=158441 RepID=A0A226F1B3_FOLCA|nr:Synaptic vesicular amine transporter [Folsomia candida]
MDDSHVASPLLHVFNILIIFPTLNNIIHYHFYHQFGGYSLPFALMGGLLFVCAWATYFFLPEIGESPSIEKGDQKLLTTSGLETFQMLRFPVIFMIAYSIVATAAGVGFLHSTLEPHLDVAQANLNKFLVGAVFILNGGVYAIGAPTWGRICDQSEQPKYFTVIGSIFTICGFILVGPLPFLPWETNLWNICIGLVLFGLGLGATLVSAFIQALQDAVALGYPDDVSTYGLVSGLWTSMTALGFFIGASSGGILSYSVGFRWGTMFVLGGQLILVVMLMVYFYTRKGKSGDNDNSGKTEIAMNSSEIIESNGTETNNSKITTATTNPTFQNDE